MPRAQIILAGDLPLDKLEALAVKYLRVVPPFKMPNSPASSLAQEASSMRVTPLGSAKQLAIHLHDNDERAVGYLAGALLAYLFFNVCVMKCCIVGR